MLPEIPTDNLYKFKTIAGMVLIAFGGWLYNENYGTYIVTLEKQAVTQKLADEARQDTNRLQHQFTTLVDATEPATRNAKVADIRASFETSLDGLQNATRENQAQAEKTSLAGYVIIIISLIACGLSGTGVRFLACGFRGWQSHQNLQDDLLRIQVASAQKALTQPPIASPSSSP